jgi:gas vesicle protein GvpL/GvpF
MVDPMPTYLYCLLNEKADPPHGLTGLAEMAVRQLVVPVATEGVIAAWVSDVARGEVERGPEGARTHDSVCAAALATGTTPLPARFGQLFDSDEACATHLAERLPDLLPAFRRVAGAVEMAVTALLPASAAAPVTATGVATGREYLLRLREAHRHEAELASMSAHLRERIADAVGGLSREEAVRLSLTPRPHVAISHLIARAGEGAYRRALAPLATGSEPGAVVVTGPTAPYTFATLDS